MEFPQNTKNRVIIQSSNPPPGNISARNKNSNLKSYMHPMFRAALFTIAKTWKQPKFPSIDEQIKKMWCISTMEYYSAIKKNQTVQFAEMWMDLGTVIRVK